jgi:2-polyprenyl-6-methoxyphenol hydroxylase-like FAD-dependent oxidoreductase
VSVRACADRELSVFAAERFCADTLAHGRLVLAGDAAHVVSPIGGQGMNLGWLDARDLAATLPRCLAHPAESDALLAGYSHRRRRDSQRAARRAELYMALGFAAPLALRRLGLWALTRAALVPHAARIFTMQGFRYAPV